MPEFVKDIEEIRRRAASRLEEGPVTTAYQLDRDQTIRILNEALATEIVCVLRYMHHYFMSTGVSGTAVAGEFKEHADAERIQQLGGKPDYNPGTLVSRSASQYLEGETLGDMIREDLIAERIVIEMYTDMIRHFADKDPTTRVMIEGILQDEEEHAADLADMLFIVEPSTGATEGVDPATHPLPVESSQRKQDRREARAGRAVSENVTPKPARSARRVPQDTESFAGRGSAVANTAAPSQPEELDYEEGRQMGATRAVRITKPNRKRAA
jgi:bacterioferritin